MPESNTINLKRKILGVLIRNARAGAGFNLTETAELLGMTPSMLGDYEAGRQEPDLPILENLARICNIPVSYFWSDSPLPAPDRDYAYSKAIMLRRKIVGLLLNEARTAVNYSQEKVAEYLDDSVEQVEHYEQGQTGIPFSRLDALTELLDVDIAYFLDDANGAKPGTPGPAGIQKTPDTSAAVGSHSLSIDLPDEVAAFIQDPASLLYIKLAMRLQSLSTETLRTLAEGILDITY